MSKYNYYLTRLDEAFRGTRTQYEAVLAELKEAEAAVRDANIYRNNEAGYVTQARKATAAAKLAEAKGKLEEAQRTIWPEYERTAARLSRELEEEVRRDNISTPDQLDPNALELLKSGIMTADDYEAMVERFNDCPTMLRMISKYAETAVDTLGNDPGKRNERARIASIAINARDGRSSLLKEWDSIVGITKKCAGIRYDGRIEYNEKMGVYWDEVSPGLMDEF